MDRCFVLVFFLTVCVWHESLALHLTSDKISVEFHVDADSNKTDAQLECRYDLDEDSLYSINWYKDSREFYRFYPHHSPQAKVFRVNGVNVDIAKSNATVVYLNSIDKSSSGSYGCYVICFLSYTTVFQETDLIAEKLTN